MKNSVYTPEEFRKSCECSEKACMIGAVLFALIALCGLMIPIYSAVNHTGNWAGSLLGGMEMLTIAFAANFASKIFRSMKLNGTPFTYDIADKIKGLSQIIEICSIVCFAVSLIIRLTGNGDLITSDSCVEPGVFFLLAWIMGLFLNALAKAFDHGAQLQQESDETL